MNSLLASIVGFLNAFLALVFIVGGAIMGKIMGDSVDYELGTMGLISGLAIGVILAIIVCGVLAIFISMRNELIAIRRLLEK